MMITPFLAPVFCRPIIPDTLFSRQIISRNSAGSVYDWAGAPLIFLNPDLGQVYAEGMSAQVTLILRLLFTLNQWKAIEKQSALGLLGGETQVLKMVDSHLQELYQQNRDEYYLLINLRQQIMEVKDREKRAAAQPKVTKKEINYINDTHAKIEKQIKQSLGIKETKVTGKKKQTAPSQDRPVGKRMPVNHLLRQQYVHSRDIAALSPAMRWPSTATGLNQVNNYYSRYLIGGLRDRPEIPATIPSRLGQDIPGRELPVGGTDLFPVMLVLHKGFQQWFTELSGDLQGPGISRTADNEPQGIPDSIKRAYKTHYQLAAYLVKEFNSTESYRLRMLLDEQQVFFNTREYLDKAVLVTLKTMEKSAFQTEYRQYRQGMMEETHRVIAELLFKNIGRTVIGAPLGAEAIAEQVNRRFQSFLNIKAGFPAVIIPEYKQEAGGPSFGDAGAGELTMAGGRRQLVNRTGVIRGRNRVISDPEALMITRVKKADGVRLDEQEMEIKAQSSTIHALTSMSDQILWRTVKLLQGMTRYEERRESAVTGNPPIGGVTIGGVTIGGRPAERAPIIMDESRVFTAGRERTTGTDPITTGTVSGQEPEKETSATVYERYPALLSREETGLTHPYQVLWQLVRALERARDITSKTVKSSTRARVHINRMSELIFNPEVRWLYQMAIEQRSLRQLSPDEGVAALSPLLLSPKRQINREALEALSQPVSARPEEGLETPLSWVQTQGGRISRGSSHQIPSPAIAYRLPSAEEPDGSLTSSPVAGIMKRVYAYSRFRPVQHRIAPVPAAGGGIVGTIISSLYADGRPGLFSHHRLPGQTGAAEGNVPVSPITDIMERIYAHPSGPAPVRMGLGQTGVPGREEKVGLAGSAANIMRGILKYHFEPAQYGMTSGQTGVPGREEKVGLAGSAANIMRGILKYHFEPAQYGMTSGQTGVPSREEKVGLAGGTVNIMRGIHEYHFEPTQHGMVSGQTGVPGREGKVGLPGGSNVNVMRSIYAYRPWLARRSFPGQAEVVGGSAADGLSGNIVENIYAYERYDQVWSEPYRWLVDRPPALDTLASMTVYQRPRGHQERDASPHSPWEAAPAPVYLASGPPAQAEAMLTMHEAGIQHLKKERRQTQEQIINQERVIQNLTDKLEDQTAIIKDLSTKVGKAPAPPVDIRAITDQVVQRLQRQLRLERQRRGMD